MEIDGNRVENTRRYLSKHAHTLQHPQNTPRYSKTAPGTPNTLPCLLEKALAISKHS